MRYFISQVCKLRNLQENEKGKMDLKKVFLKTTQM